MSGGLVPLRTGSDVNACPANATGLARVLERRAGGPDPGLAGGWHRSQAATWGQAGRSSIGVTVAPEPSADVLFTPERPSGFSRVLTSDSPHGSRSRRPGAGRTLGRTAVARDEPAPLIEPAIREGTASVLAKISSSDLFRITERPTGTPRHVSSTGRHGMAVAGHGDPAGPCLARRAMGPAPQTRYPDP